MAERPLLSVIVPVRDEIARLPGLLAGIEAQTLRPAEVIVADGRSTDGSREWLAGARAGRPWLVVVHNERRTVPAALNLAVRAARGELVARMDAHADYAADYLEQLVKVLDYHPKVVGVGGAMHTSGRGPWGGAIAATLRRRLGLGGARHRVDGGAGPIPHVFTGCYRRRSLLAAGGYDERLLANEDYEMDVRLRRAGGTIWLHPDARCTWYVRASMPALAVQMFRYGFFKALTMRLHPGSVQPRQVAPPLLIVTVAGLSLRSPRYGLAVLAAYLGVASTAGALAAGADGASIWRGAAVPPLVHLSWGSGLLTGLAYFAVPRHVDRPYVR